jgi:hypothetical protein
MEQVNNIIYVIDIIRNHKKVFKKLDVPQFIPKLNEQKDLARVYKNIGNNKVLNNRQSGIDNRR